MRIALQSALLLALLTTGAHATLVNHWSFDEGSGTSATDAVGGNTGTLNNMEPGDWVADSPFGVGTSLSFDGVNEDISLNSNIQFHWTSPFSLSLWYKGTEPATGQQIYSYGLLGWDNNSIFANLTLFEGKTVYAHYDCGWLDNIKSVSSVNDGQWHHIVYVNKTGALGDLYIDGVKEIADASSTFNCSGPVPYRIANFMRGFPSVFTEGQLDDVRIYNHSLSGGEVDGLYAPPFVEVAGNPNINLDDSGNGRGVAWADYDNDNDLDLYHSIEGGPNRLFENTNGSFADVAGTALVADGGTGGGVAWADFDNDGDLDLYLVNQGGANILYKNNGPTFSQVGSGSDPINDAGNGKHAVWGDYNNDGRVDLYLAQWAGANRLYRNDGNDNFADVANVVADGANTVSAAWADYDNDADLDLYSVNSGSANNLYRNDSGSFAFVSVGVADTRSGHSAAWGDYDNDGNIDLHVANNGQGDGLYKNDGNGAFTSEAANALIENPNNSVSGAWADFDNDGDLDLHLTLWFGQTDRLFENGGAGTFAEIGATAGVDDTGNATGAAWADYDADGDLDLYLANYGSANRFYHNNGSGNNYLQVALTGISSNQAGIGARVSATIGSNDQIREVDGGSSHASQGSLPVEFGLGSATQVDVLTITWPSGIVQTLNNVTSNQLLPITEPIVVNIDPVAYIGTYNAANQGYVSGPSSLTLAAGTYSFSNGTSSFNFTVAANGDVTSLNPDAATGNGNTLTLNNVAFNVDPVNYIGAYDAISGAPFVTGPQSFVAIPNLTGRLFNGNSSFQFTVDAGGNITHSNPDAASVSGNTITFNNIAFNVDPVNYAGQYSALSGGVYFTGPQTFIGIPSFNSRIANGTSSFTFNIAVNGDITSLNSDAATSNGNTLVFNNTNVEVDPTTYAGLYAVTGFPGWFSSISQMILVPDLTVRLTADGESDTFTADANQVTPPSFDLTISGQPHTFNFSVKNDQEVVIPDVTATYNELIAIPVTISGTGSTPIVAAEVFVCYDSNLLTPVGTDITGTLLTANWAIETNIEDGGQIDTYKIAMATDDDDITGPGTLINITFQVADVRVPSSSALTLKHVLFNDGDPGNVTTDGSLTLTGTDGTITSLPATIIPRETVTVTVVDADLDTDGAPGTDNVVVSIDNGGNSDTINLTLNEDGTTAGTFSATYDTEFGNSAIVDALIQAKNGDAIVATYADALDGAGAGPTDRTATTNVIGGADGSVEITIVSQPGDPLYIQVTDADLNTSTSSAQTASVTVENTTTNDIFVVVLDEADDNDDVFFGSLPTTAGASTGTELGTSEDDVVTVTYDDVVTLDGDQLDRTDDNDVIFPWGDADDNDVLQAFDAAKILVHVLNGSPIDEQAANVDDETITSGINPFDASLVLQKRVGLIATFPVQDPTSENHPQGTASPKLVTEQRHLSLVMGDGYLSVHADDRDGLIAGDLTLTGINGRAEMGAELADYLSASKTTDDGVRIVFAGAEAVSGPGELLRVYGSAPTSVELTSAVFNNGNITGTASGLTAMATPMSFALHPNIPNPFNPETTIRFELPQAAEVRLEVFDSIGQKIRTLVAGSLSAGTHTAIWHGRNDDGVQVGNGVYLYRIQASEFTQMRRMLLLK